MSAYLRRPSREKLQDLQNRFRSFGGPSNRMLRLEVSTVALRHALCSTMRAPESEQADYVNHGTRENLRSHSGELLVVQQKGDVVLKYGSVQKLAEYIVSVNTGDFSAAVLIFSVLFLTVCRHPAAAGIPSHISLLRFQFLASGIPHYSVRRRSQVLPALSRTC